MDCIFCKIANNLIPTEKIYEDDKVVVFNDLEPQAPIHILIIPRVHIGSLNDITDKNKDIISHIFCVASKIAMEKGLTDGYRIVNNCGVEGGQTVRHLHFHLLGGRSMKWPPG